MFPEIFQYLNNLQTVGGVAGTIAILITVTLCAGFIRNQTAQPGEVGRALIYALTTIIGFYFGTAAGEKMPTSPPPAAISQPSTK